MRRIFRAINQSETAQAWIGGSAPIPDGWHLDPDSAKSAFNPSKGEESHAVRQEEAQGPEEVISDLVHRGPPAEVGPIGLATEPVEIVALKKRGRPRKVV